MEDPLHCLIIHDVGRARLICVVSPLMVVASIDNYDKSRYYLDLQFECPFRLCYLWHSSQFYNCSVGGFCPIQNYDELWHTFLWALLSRESWLSGRGDFPRMVTSRRMRLPMKYYSWNLTSIKWDIPGIVKKKVWGVYPAAARKSAAAAVEACVQLIMPRRVAIKS